MSTEQSSQQSSRLGDHHATAVIDNGDYGTRHVTFSTGRLARQAAGSVVARLGDTVVLSTTAAGKHPKEHFDFFPLTVDVEERMYAAGRIPGSFFRREGRPSEDAILTCRLIDRGLRPSFVKGLRNEVQIVETVLALDEAHPYDVVAMNGASASTSISGLPAAGPLGSTRIANIQGSWVAFPTLEQLEKATFDMVVTGRVIDGGDVAIMMVEAEATDNTVALVADGATAPTEEVVAAGLDAAKPVIAELCRAQRELIDAAAKPAVEFPLYPEYGEDVLSAVEDEATSSLSSALTIADKQEREGELDRIKAELVEKLAGDFVEREGEISAALRSLTKKLVRKRVLTEGVRIDGPLKAAHRHVQCVLD